MFAGVGGDVFEDVVHAVEDEELGFGLCGGEDAGVGDGDLDVGGALDDEHGDFEFCDLFCGVVFEPGDQVRLDAGAVERGEGLRDLVDGFALLERFENGVVGFGEIGRELSFQLFDKGVGGGLAGSFERDEFRGARALRCDHADERAFAMAREGNSFEAFVGGELARPGGRVVDVGLEAQVLLAGPGGAALANAAFVVAEGGDAAVAESFGEKAQAIGFGERAGIAVAVGGAGAGDEKDYGRRGFGLRDFEGAVDFSGEGFEDRGLGGMENTSENKDTEKHTGHLASVVPGGLILSRSIDIADFCVITDACMYLPEYTQRDLGHSVQAFPLGITSANFAPLTE